MALDGLEVIAHARATIPENPLVGVTTMAEVFPVETPATTQLVALRIS
jgi:hypothetical protein